MPFEPNRAGNIQTVLWEVGTPFPSEALTKAVYRGLSYIKQARVAIMADYEILNEIHSNLAEYLDPTWNYHWSGPNRKHELTKHLPRVLVGEYVQWFRWYLQFQRFKAFHTVVLIGPVSAVLDDEEGGFIDGLLARLITKVPRIIVIGRGNVETPSLSENRLNATLLTLLYGTRLSRDQLLKASKLTIIPIDSQTLQSALDSGRWRNNLHNSRYELSEDDEQLVEGMVPKWKSYESGEPAHEIVQLVRRPQKREYVKADLAWVKNEILKLVRARGWFTFQTLDEFFSQRYREFARATEPPPAEAYPHLQRQYRTAAQIFFPSPSIIRKACDELVETGSLVKRTWYRERGRPALIYTGPEGALPFDDNSRCGQCSFYVASKNRCQIWALAHWKYRSWGFRWEGPGPNPNEFEMYKMKNSHRISSHSSACRFYLDKKRDHLRNRVPHTCEICAIDLPPHPGSVICSNCGTIYSPWGGMVRVQTGYEHEFRRRYKLVTGSEAEEDQRKQREEWGNSPQRDFERTLPLTSEREVITTERPKPERGPWPRPNYSLSLQRRVDEMARATSLAKQLTLAMMRSAVNATRRLATVGRPDPNLLAESIRRQERYLLMIDEAKVGSLVTSEAHAMKEYWACYDSALKPAQQWFGPRVRFRFVVERVGEPGGSAKGYSALHAAINYLHQRRFRQALRINAEVGFEGTADGFLHRESYNSRHTGLTFDLIDPFKFADREELLAIVLNRDITWRDFMMDSDRHGSTFYYPASSALATLDQAGSDADQLVVRYQGINLSLIDAYSRFATSLLTYLEAPSEFKRIEAYIYDPL